MTTSIDFTKINFDDIKTELNDYIKATSDFNSYNFDSSNITLIVNLLSYVTNILNYYINQAVNENYIDSVRLRKNLLSIVKLLNYLPARTTSSYVYVDLTATPVSVGTDVVIPRYSLFTAGSYNFYNTEELVFEQAESYTLNNIKLTEGNINQESFTGDGTEFQEFIIENTLMGDYLRVWTYVLDNEGNETTVEVDWDLYTEQLALPNPTNAKIYFLEETEIGYKISGGNGSFGLKPINGNQFNIDYLESSGADANEITEDQFSFSGTGTNLDTLVLEFSTDSGYSTSQSIGGAVKESMDEIKFNAPRYYSTQGRAVTDDDYLTIAIQRADVAKASVIGGQDLTPVELGVVYLYLKPTSGLTFTQTELDAIRQYFIDSYSVITINPICRNPEYVYFDITSTIRYTSDRPSTTNIINALDVYINQTIQEFGTYFKYSGMIGTIDDSDALISSNLTVLKKYRFLTTDDNVSGDSYAFYLSKNLASGTTFYIEEWTKDATPILNNTINEGSLSLLSKSLTNGYITFDYASFNFTTYTYKIYFNTDTDDVFANFQQIFYIDTDNDLSLTFEKITI